MIHPCICFWNQYPYRIDYDEYPFTHCWRWPSAWSFWLWWEAGLTQVTHKHPKTKMCPAIIFYGNQYGKWWTWWRFTLFDYHLEWIHESMHDQGRRLVLLMISTIETGDLTWLIGIEMRGWPSTTGTMWVIYIHIYIYVSSHLKVIGWGLSKRNTSEARVWFNIMIQPNQLLLNSAWVKMSQKIKNCGSLGSPFWVISSYYSWQ